LLEGEKYRKLKRENDVEELNVAIAKCRNAIADSELEL
jgi:hypothetical protein